jgi:lysophospholipase L1-like esterase
MAVQPNPRISANAPRIQGDNWQGYDLSGIPERGRVIAVWYDTGTFDRIGEYSSREFSLYDYVIEANTDGIWKPLLTVTDNLFSTRQHVLDLQGASQIRLRMLRHEGTSRLRFDIHDARDGISDSWLFLGDSITACGMGNAWGTSFAEYIHALDPRFCPVQQNGGIGGLTSRDGKVHIQAWIAGNPAHFVPVAFGTNDAWGLPNDLKAYESNVRYMLDTVLDAGKIPVLPTIPYASDPHAGRCTAEYNAVIAQLYTAYGKRILHGPDLYGFFREYPELLSEDGVHPSADGYEALRKLWAETMYRAAYC